MKNKMSRLILFIAIAIMANSLTFQIVDASAPVWLSQQSAYLVGGPGGAITIAHSGCGPDGGAGGTTQCRRMIQNNSNPSTYQYNSLSPQKKVSNVYAYSPAIGEAAVIYTVIENGYHSWSTVVNQSAITGSVYLGFTDLPNQTSVVVRMANSCVSGYWCGGLNVYWDDVWYVVKL